VGHFFSEDFSQQTDFFEAGYYIMLAGDLPIAAENYAPLS